MASEPVTPVEIAAEFEVTRGRVLGLVEQMAVCRALIAVTAERDRLRAVIGEATANLQTEGWMKHTPAIRATLDLCDAALAAKEA